MKAGIICAALCLYILSINLYLYVLGTGQWHLELKYLRIWYSGTVLFLVVNIIISLLSNKMAVFQFEFIIISLAVLAVTLFTIILNYAGLVHNPYYLLSCFNFCSILTIFIIFTNLNNNNND